MNECVRFTGSESVVVKTEKEEVLYVLYMYLEKMVCGWKLVDLSAPSLPGNSNNTVVNNTVP